MKSHRLLAFVLLASGALLAHPIAEPAELPYPEPASMEERAFGPLDELSLPDGGFPPQDAAGLRYSTLISGEINREGVRGASLLPRGLKREVLLGSRTLLSPLGRAPGVRRPLGKRTGNSECFWKYCV